MKKKQSKTKKKKKTRIVFYLLGSIKKKQFADAKLKNGSREVLQRVLMIHIDIYEGFRDTDKENRIRKVAEAQSERESREVPERVRSDISRGVVLGRL
jgi:hypothetical protein